MRALLLSTLMLFAATTRAQSAAAPVEVVPDDVDAALDASAKKADAKREEGWDVSARVGASGSFLHNRQVVGQLDGLTLQSGMVLGGAATLLLGQHEWHNTAGYELSVVKTPAIAVFLKSADNLEARSLYLYRVPGLEWLGPYARVRSYTQVFPGYAVPASDVFVRRTSVAGDVDVFLVEGQTPIDLSTWFEPIVIYESVGGYVRPYDEKWLSVNAKAGVGGQHILALGDGYVVADDASTPELEIQQLQTVHSAGFEVELELKGIVLKDISYGMIATVYYPVLLSVETDLDAVERTNVDVTGNFSYKLTDWLSADYVVKVRRVPLVLNDWQVQNSLLLTLGFSLL